MVERCIQTPCWMTRRYVLIGSSIFHFEVMKYLGRRQMAAWCAWPSGRTVCPATAVSATCTQAGILKHQITQLMVRKMRLFSKNWWGEEDGGANEDGTLDFNFEIDFVCTGTHQEKWGGLKGQLDPHLWVPPPTNGGIMVDSVDSILNLLLCFHFVTERREPKSILPH